MAQIPNKAGLEGGCAPVHGGEARRPEWTAHLFISLLYRFLGRSMIGLSLLFWLHTPGFAQVTKEYQLKAVFLWRLAQFTQWPSGAFESPDSPILICVFGENPFDGALIAAVSGETAHGRRLVVQQPRVLEQIKSCHILYLAGAATRQAKAVAAALAGRSVLTVRDVERPESGLDTIVGFVTEENKIKIRANPKAAAAAGLVLDPRLMRAAEIVGE